MVCREGSDVGRGKIIQPANVDSVSRSGGGRGRINAIALGLCNGEAVCNGLVRKLDLDYLYPCCARCETY